MTPSIHDVAHNARSSAMRVWTADGNNFMSINDNQTVNQWPGPIPST